MDLQFFIDNCFLCDISELFFNVLQQFYKNFDVFTLKFNSLLNKNRQIWNQTKLRKAGFYFLQNFLKI
jgi:hypothetical protein